MVGVYSHWQKPFVKYGGGYNSRRHFLSSLAFSAVLSKSHFDSVVIYCDKEAVEEMKALNVFDEVIPCYQEFHSVPAKHWAIAKMLVYSKQTEPFLHIDNDVFLLKTPPEKLLQGRLIAQSVETCDDFGHRYTRQVAAIERSLNPPKWWVSNWHQKHKEEGAAFCYNAGIFGGSELDLIKDYAITGIAHVKRFGHQYADVNTTIEQLYFAMMAHTTQIPVSTIIKGWSEINECKEVGYRHFWGGTKRLADPITNIPYMETANQELSLIRPDVAHYINTQN